MTIKGVALITGGSLRIGNEICKQLSYSGYEIIIHYRNSINDAIKLNNEINQSGGKSSIIQCDLNDYNDLNSLIDRCNQLNTNGVNILVNNASLFEYDNFNTISNESFDNHMNVNIKAPTILSSNLYKALLKTNKAGCIINILDQKLANTNGDHLSYTISKYALLGLTDTLARSLTPLIRVNAIAPGFTLPSYQQTSTGFEISQSQSPLQYGPSPLDIAESVVYLVNAKCVTGQTIYVDAGERFNSRKRDVSFETELDK